MNRILQDKLWCQASSSVSTTYVMLHLMRPCDLRHMAGYEFVRLDVYFTLNAAVL